eukprot:680463-Hanusia_phi.AAC.5
MSDPRSAAQARLYYGRPSDRRGPQRHSGPGLVRLKWPGRPCFPAGNTVTVSQAPGVLQRRCGFRAD